MSVLLFAFLVIVHDTEIKFLSSLSSAPSIAATTKIDFHAAAAAHSKTMQAILINKLRTIQQTEGKLKLALCTRLRKIFNLSHINRMFAFVSAFTACERERKKALSRFSHTKLLSSDDLTHTHKIYAEKSICYGNGHTAHRTQYIARGTAYAQPDHGNFNSFPLCDLHLAQCASNLGCTRAISGEHQ